MSITLYFDNYITDEALNKKGFYRSLDQVRAACPAYAKPSRFDVALYTLASYEHLDFDHVFVKYELADKSRTNEFESFLRQTFGDRLIISQGRSDNQKKFRESVERIQRFGDEWVFYAGNADHPFMAPDNKTFEACMKMAGEMKKTNPFVSIPYSNLQEFNGFVRRDSVLYDPRLKVLAENERCTAVRCYATSIDSARIVSRELLEQWFCSRNLNDRRLIRSDDLIGLVEVPNEVMVIPKGGMCEHFDGYSHVGGLFRIADPSSIVPPLFLPAGFFERNLRIAYGYDDYRPAWVNINPLKKKYVFEDPRNGTDLKMSLERLPFFWKSRIRQTDINPGADRQKLEEAAAAELERQLNPWPCPPWPHSALARTRVRLAKFRHRLYVLRVYAKNPEQLEERLRAPGHPVAHAGRRLLHGAIVSAHRVGLLKRGGHGPQ